MAKEMMFSGGGECYYPNLAYQQPVAVNKRVEAAELGFSEDELDTWASEEGLAVLVTTSHQGDEGDEAKRITRALFDTRRVTVDDLAAMSMYMYDGVPLDEARVQLAATHRDTSSVNNPGYPS